MKLNFVHLTIAGCVILMGLIFAWTVFQWIECRDLGFSVLYCAQHVA